MTRILKLRLAREKAVQIRHVARQFQPSGQFATIDTNTVFSYGKRTVQS